MQVSEFMTVSVWACLPEQSCATAGAIMRRHHCGFLPVVNRQSTKQVIGVLTDRDIMLHLVRLNQPASRVSVKACMTEAPMMITSEANFEEAVRLMKKSARRRLPVIERGRLVGVLSLQDIALAARRQWAYVRPHVTEQHVTEILEAIAIAREQRTVLARR
jgi:CBS domain-containing protein